NMPRVGHMAMRRAAGPDAVRGPQFGAVRIEQNIAFALKCGCSGRVPDEETMLLHPGPQKGCLQPALAVIEARERSDAMMDHGSVAKESHVRAAGLGMQQTHVGHALQRDVELFPLREGCVAGRS